MSVLNRKNIPVSQQKKDECNARAQQIVLNLIDGTEDESVLFEQVDLGFFILVLNNK